MARFGLLVNHKCPFTSNILVHLTHFREKKSFITDNQLIQIETCIFKNDLKWSQNPNQENNMLIYKIDEGQNVPHVYFSGQNALVRTVLGRNVRGRNTPSPYVVWLQSILPRTP